MTDEDNQAPAEPGLSAGESAELGELQQAMKDTHSWGHDPIGQARAGELYGKQEAFERGEEAPAALRQPGALETRKAELQELMSDQLSSYWRGPQSQALQAEYLALLEGREVSQVTPEAAATWSEHLEISEAAVHQAHGMALQIEEALGPEVAADVEASIDALSDGAQDLVRVILSDPGNPAIPYTDETAQELRDWFGRMPADEQAAIRDVLGVDF